jgi:iron complex transport system permease protein
VLVVLGIALAVAMTVGLAVGPVTIAPSTVLRILTHRVLGGGLIGGEVNWTVLQDDIVWNLRLPRVLLGVVVGAALATAGVLIQVMVRNPLADPYLLGISQGASVGAVAFIVLGIGAFGVSSTTGAATVGAIGAFTIVYLLARAAGTESSLRLVLAGIAVGYGFQAVVNFLLLLADNPSETNTALFWLIGSLAAARWDKLAVPVVVIFVVLVAVFGRAATLNALLLGDETAAASGVSVARLRRELLLAASALTAAAVAVSGAIGFVGLVVPHACRLFVGGEHRRLLPTAALAGALFLVAADIVARVAFEARELPIGVITGAVGAPLFAALILGRRHRVAAT